MFQLIGDLCCAVTMKVTTIHEVYWIINFACDLKKARIKDTEKTWPLNKFCSSFFFLIKPSEINSILYALPCCHAIIHNVLVF